MRRVQSSWKIIDSVLKQNAHASFKALRPPATESSLERLQAHFDERLPRDFLASLRVHDGMRKETVFVNYLSFLPVSGILRWSKMHRGIQKMMEFEGSGIDRKQIIHKDKRWRDGWMPIMADAGGNHLVMDLDPGPRGKIGQIYHWYNNDGPSRIVTPSLSIWLDAIATELSDRRFTIDSFGEIQTDEHRP